MSTKQEQCQGRARLRGSASYEHLGLHLAPTAAAIAKEFIPLRADPVRVEELRATYRARGTGRPLVGLSWHSSNTGKDMPAAADWAALIDNLPAEFVSVNYGYRDEDVARMEREAGKPVLAPLVDQIASLDDFAAQVASLDHVVTISNSTAHLAGALGTPATLVLTPFAGMTWPVEGARSPWYPHLRIVRPTPGRSWRDRLHRIASTIDLSLA